MKAQITLCVFILLSMNIFGQNIQPLVTYPRVVQIENIILPDNLGTYRFKNQKQAIFVVTGIYTNAGNGGGGGYSTITTSTGVNIISMGTSQNFNTGIKLSTNDFINVAVTGIYSPSALITGYYEETIPTYTQTQVSIMLDELNKKLDSTKAQLFQAVNTATNKALNEIQQDAIMEKLRGEISNQIKNLEEQLKLISDQIKDLKKPLSTSH